MRSAPGSTLLAALAGPARPTIPAECIAVIVAHPDDETIAVGGQLSRMPGVTVIHVTQGAPANLADARRYGFMSQADYAAARRQELEAAMALAGVPAERLLCLGIEDQGASAAMAEVARRLADLFAERGIAAVITHPYEGGHPDHDATAFAVHAAAALLAGRGQTAPAILEAPFYHAGPDGMVAQRFVSGPMIASEGRTPGVPGEAAERPRQRDPARVSNAEELDPLPLAALGRGLEHGACSEIAVALDPESFALKQRMLDAHTSQAGVLAAFRDPAERFRLAPPYDFDQAPNGGRLHYEQFDWGMTGARWRELAAAARRALAIGRAA